MKTKSRVLTVGWIHCIQKLVRTCHCAAKREILSGARCNGKIYIRFHKSYVCLYAAAAGVREMRHYCPTFNCAMTYLRSVRPLLASQIRPTPSPWHPEEPARYLKRPCYLRFITVTVYKLLPLVLGRYSNAWTRHRPDGKPRCCNLAVQYRAIIIVAVRNCDDIRWVKRTCAGRVKVGKGRRSVSQTQLLSEPVWCILDVSAFMTP